MRRKHRWLSGLGLLFALAITLTGHGFIAGNALEFSAIAQTPEPTPPPLTSPDPTPPANPDQPLPQVPVAPSAIPAPPAPPASTAPPLPVGSNYQDPAGRFKVGVLAGYRVTPLAGAVIIEAPDGRLAYSVIAKAQPLGNPIGLITGYDNSESLAKVAIAEFQRGEGFQPGPPRLESEGGAVLDWKGSLTIGNQAQPVSGTILVRPNPQTVLLLMVAATEAGQQQLPNALSALAASLEPL